MRALTLVRDVMRPPVLVPDGMWFQEIVRRLRVSDAGCAIVVDRLGWPIGALSEEDLLARLADPDRAGEAESAARRATRRRAVAVTARELMSEPLISVAGSLPAAAAASLMRERGVRHLAVLDQEGRPGGLVDRSALLEPLLRPDLAIRQDVEDLLRRLVRERAASVTVDVRDGVVVLVSELQLAGLLEDVEEVEGVIGVRREEPAAADGGRCAS
jgi:CBS domain-containing protein